MLIYICVLSARHTTSWIGLSVKVKVKASHALYRALGPELILVYRQSACRWP